MKTGRALLAVVTGLAAGAAFGLIFSPQHRNRSQKKGSRRTEALETVLSKRMDEKLGQLESRILARRNAEQQR